MTSPSPSGRECGNNRHVVNMSDVADAAGVSQAAVSYAYNRPEKLSGAQREHILATAAKLKYPGPNVIGSSLRSGKVGAIGVMVMDSMSYAFSDDSTKALLEGVVRVRQLDDMALTLIPLAHREYGLDGTALEMSHDARPALRGLVDGAILHSLPDDNPALRILLRRGIPVVIVDAPFVETVPMIRIEDRKAAFAQVDHLVQLGHRRIGFLAERLRPDGMRGPVSRERRSMAVEHVVRERLEGYEAACLFHGIPFDSVPVIEAGGFSREAGLTAAADLLDNDLTAVVATSDTMALAVLEVAQARGLSVPSDLSVFGFDDAPGASAAGLTTVRQPMVEKGELAAQMLLALLSGAEQVDSQILPWEVVIRNTTSSVSPSPA